MKLNSQNNTKFPNHVIKRAHEINSEKKAYLSVYKIFLDNW